MHLVNQHGQRPEFIAHGLAQWAESMGVARQHIQPGELTQKAFAERFNITRRIEVLDCYAFDSRQEVRDMADDCQHRYSHQKPHASLGRIPPSQTV